MNKHGIDKVRGGIYVYSDSTLCKWLIFFLSCLISNLNSSDPELEEFLFNFCHNGCNFYPLGVQNQSECVSVSEHTRSVFSLSLSHILAGEYNFLLPNMIQAIRVTHAPPGKKSGLRYELSQTYSVYFCDVY